MKDRFQQLLQLFMAATPATRIALAVGTLAILVIGGATSWFANRPDFVEMWQGLTPTEASEYKKALAQAGINFVSSPAPDNGIWVDVADRHAAEAQVALAGYTPITKGIKVADGGPASAFLSARAREQMSDKREWEECEVQLETLHFILRATVASSGSNSSPYGQERHPTISVTIGLRPGVRLDAAQSHTVASIVRGRFNVPMENITVVDEQGNLLHDGMESSGGMSSSDLFSHKLRHDNAAERKANLTLERAFGVGLAYVTVNSSWDYIESESVKESAMANPTPYYEAESTSTNGGISTASGGPAGVSSNITQDFGNESAGVGGGSQSGGGFESTTTETRSVVGRETEHLKRKTPIITRMSVSLVVDKSKADQIKEITELVKANVGFDEKRDDVFQSLSTELASIKRDDAGEPLPPEVLEPVEAPNAYMELGLQYGVEILAALGFLFVLLKSLKGGNAKAGALAGANGGGAGQGGAARQPSSPIIPGTVTDANPAGITEEEIANIDPSALARTQVEDLVRNHPEKVSEILAYWASNSRTVGAGR